MTEEAMQTPKPSVKRSKKKDAGEEAYLAVGRRKTGIARVRLTKGSGAITVNKKDHEDYVSKRHRLIAEINKPFATLNIAGQYDADIICNGGGISSQAEAIKLGIARALILMNPELKSALSKAGCLARDSRMKERKKYGRKKARKRFQYSKR